jgi:hypothetical protein
VARFMVLAIEPCPVPSLERGFHRLILQEEIIFEQRKVWINP